MLVGVSQVCKTPLHDRRLGHASVVHVAILDISVSSLIVSTAPPLQANSLVAESNATCPKYHLWLAEKEHRAAQRNAAAAAARQSSNLSAAVVAAEDAADLVSVSVRPRILPCPLVPQSIPPSVLPPTLPPVPQPPSPTTPDAAGYATFWQGYNEARAYPRCVMTVEQIVGTSCRQCLRSRPY